MKTCKIFLFVAICACFAQKSLQAVDRCRSRILKTAVALTAIGAAGKVAVTFPQPTAVFVVSANAGLLVTAAAYHAGRYSGAFDSTTRHCIGAANILGFGVGVALNDYIPNTTAAGAGYVLTCGTLATLPTASLADVVGIGGWR